MPSRASVALCAIILLAIGGLALQARGQSVPDLLRLPDSPAMRDPARPLKIGEEFYPEESLKLKEQGTCVVQMGVSPSGAIHDARIVTSSGFERLDAACISAVSGGHLIPAIRNGVPVETTTTLPINWSLPATLADCMAIPASLTLEQAQAAIAADPRLAKSGAPAKVILRLFVSATGSIDGIKVDQSSGYPRLDQASIKGVTGQKMLAATINGVGVSSCTRLPIVYKIKP